METLIFTQKNGVLMTNIPTAELEENARRRTLPSTREEGLKHKTTKHGSARRANSPKLDATHEDDL